MLDKMQKCLAMIVLVVCAAGVCRAGDAPSAWVNAVDTNAMERVLLDYTNNVRGIDLFHHNGFSKVVFD